MYINHILTVYYKPANYWVYIIIWLTMYYINISIIYYISILTIYYINHILNSILIVYISHITSYNII